MGSCLSNSLSTSQYVPPENAATVIALNGELKECPTPITAAKVLDMFQSSSSSSGYIVCNSDSLCYDEYIPAMKADEELQANQIYFILPKSRLQYRLSATDMAAMAVKASVALQKGYGKRKKARISPVLDESAHQESSRDQQQTITPGYRKAVDVKDVKAVMSGGGGFARSGSIRRLQRYSSRRAKLAVRSFRLMLSTIYE